MHAVVVLFIVSSPCHKVLPNIYYSPDFYSTWCFFFSVKRHMGKIAGKWKGLSFNTNPILELISISVRRKAANVISLSLLDHTDDWSDGVWMTPDCHRNIRPDAGILRDASCSADIPA